MCGCSHSTTPLSSVILFVRMGCAIQQDQRQELYIIFLIHNGTTIVSPIDWLEVIVSSKNLFGITANGQHPLPKDAGLVLELFMVQAIRVDWLSSLFSRPGGTRLTTSSYCGCRCVQALFLVGNIIFFSRMTPVRD